MFLLFSTGFFLFILLPIENTGAMYYNLLVKDGDLMLLTVSNNGEFIKKLSSLYLDNAIFSEFCSTSGLSNFVTSETLLADFVLIDAKLSTKELRSVRDILTKKFPHAGIGVFGRPSVLSENVTYLFSDDELLEFLYPLREKFSLGIDQRRLKITTHDRSVILLGYQIRLTPKEHKILLLLLSDPRRIFTSEEISRLAFPLENRISKNQIAVHICNINKKAFPITERALIENSHKTGYSLNPCL